MEKKQKLTYDLYLVNKIFKANLKSLISVSQDGLDEQERQYKDYFKKLQTDETENDSLERGAHFANIHWILLNSILLSSYSFFENHLFKLSKIVEDRLNSKIKIENIKGSGVIKYCNYLFLVGEITCANRAIKNWQDVNYFQKVRNLIAHNGGMMITDPTKKLENHECFKFLKRHTVIMAGTFGHIRIRDLTLIETFCNISSTLSDNLTQEIEKKYFKNNC